MKQYKYISYVIEADVNKYDGIFVMCGITLQKNALFNKIVEKKTVIVRSAQHDVIIFFGTMQSSQSDNIAASLNALGRLAPNEILTSAVPASSE